MFVGVGTVVAGLKVMKAAKLAQAITEVAKVADKLDVTTKILSKAGVSLKKIGPKAGKFIARNANGSEILNSGFEVVNGIYKNLKKKTNAHTVFLGYIDAQVQFVGEQTKKVRCKLWGKCRAGSVNTANFRIVAGVAAPCEGISEVAGEVVEVIKRNLHRGELGNISYVDFLNNKEIYKNLTGHHIPSKSYFDKYCEKFGLDKSKIMGGGHGNNLMTILLESGEKPNRHARTKSFRNNLGSQRPDYNDLSPEDAMKYDIEDLAKILKEDGVWDEVTKKKLVNFIEANKQKFPTIFKTYPKINWPTFN